MSLKGFDYAGGRPSGQQIRNAGGMFVCRYLTDGGSGLPGKQLQQWEINSMRAAGVAIVCNFETTADRAMAGYNAGRADAVYSSNYVAQLGLAGAPIYFSVDFDVAPGQQGVINSYLQGCCDAIGKNRVGVYGGYWCVKRALDAGVASWAWQASAWSGGNVDPRAHIYQNANAGYAYIAGVECDINFALQDNFGQYGADNPEELDMDANTLKGIIYECLETYVGPVVSDVKDLREQVTGSRDLIVDPNSKRVNLQKSYPGQPILGQRTLDDTVAAIGEKLGVKGCVDPKPNGDGVVVQRGA